MDSTKAQRNAQLNVVESEISQINPSYQGIQSRLFLLNPRYSLIFGDGQS